MFNGTYSYVNVHRIAAVVNYWLPNANQQDRIRTLRSEQLDPTELSTDAAAMQPQGNEENIEEASLTTTTTSTKGCSIGPAASVLEIWIGLGPKTSPTYAYSEERSLMFQEACSPPSQVCTELHPKAPLLVLGKCSVKHLESK